MRNVKHGILSLIRKPTKAVMIFVILFVVFSMVFTGVIIQKSIAESRNFIRLGLGAVVEYKADFMKAMKDNLDYESYDQLALSMGTADTIGEDSRVDKVYITSMAGVESDQYQMASTGSESNNMVMMGGAYFTIKGTKDHNSIEFDNDQLTLIAGQMPDEIDTNIVEYPVIVSDAFASKNNVGLQDTLKFTGFGHASETEFTIVGIFTSDSESSANTFYSQYDVVNKFNQVEAGQTDAASSIYFKLKDPLDVEAFIEEYKELLPSEYTVLDAGNSEYDKLTKPLDLMNTISNMFIIIVFVAGAAITVALVSIFVRDRKFEIGLLLASGESKAKIVSQFVIEITIVAIIAFGASLLLSYESSEQVSNWIVENQLIEDESSDSDFGMIMSFEESQVGEVTMDKIAQDFDVTISSDLVLKLFVISLMVIFIASLIPLFVIMSFKPREALQD